MRRFLILPLAATLLAQPPEPDLRARRRAAAPQAFHIAELALAAPPEFAAHALLRLLDANAVPTPDWQRELATEALRLASAARHPIRRKLAPNIVSIDHQAMLWNVAHNQGLDALSLSARAILHLRRLDPAAASAAFDTFPRPTPANPACPEPLTSDPAPYFAAAARLQRDPLPLIQSLQSHQEIAPAIDLIFQSRPSPDQLDTLAGALGARLAALPSASRAFHAALFDAPAKIRHLYTVLDSNQRPTAPLAEGWRAWLQNGLSAPPCQENYDEARAAALEAFNKVVNPPLPASLLKSESAPEPTNLQPFADSEEFTRQTQLFKEILFAPTKSTPEWREKLQQYVQSIERRTRSASESDIEYFYRQTQLWSGVLMSAPPGPARDRALNQFLAFLLANAPHTDPVLWFSQLEQMAAVTRSLHGADYPKLLQALHQSGHPALQLFAALESAFPERPDSR